MEEKCYQVEKNRTYIINKPYWNTKTRRDSSYYHQHPIYEKAKQILINNNLTNSKVIDLGCGTANKITKQIIPYCRQYVGIDQEHIININRKTYSSSKIRFVSGDLEENLKIKEQFDVIICADVIEHLDKPERLLKNIKKLSHEKTIIILSTPERYLMKGEYNADHVQEWTKKEIELYLKSKGFRIVKHNIVNCMKRPNKIIHLYKYIKKLFNNKLKTTQQIIMIVEPKEKVK